MIIFYAPDIENSLILPEGESKHCIKVLRKSVGDIINVVDGFGNMFECRLVDNNPRCAAVEITKKETHPLHWKFNITIAVAPTKNMDRIEWLVEKLTEIGVNKIVPVKCCRSERKDLKVDRLKKIAVSAMKQSLKARIPEICELTPIDSLLRENTDSDNFICYCHPSIPKQILSRIIKPGKSVTVLIGPEGDFSPDEIALAINNGWKPVTLGDNRLRTETAALVAADTVHIVNQIKE